MRNAYNILIGKPEMKRKISEDLGVVKTIILKWILWKERLKL
jgi:hypothetical protein